MSALIRASAFVRKEWMEILRQPRLLFSLIMGPFLILLLFGLGYRNDPRNLRTLFVLPDNPALKQLVEERLAEYESILDVQGIIEDATVADAELRNQAVDLVIVLNNDPSEILEQNEQSVLSFFHYEIDPYEESYVNVVGRTYINEVNREVLLTAVQEGQAESEQMLGFVQEAREQTELAQQQLESNQIAEARDSLADVQDKIGVVRSLVGAGASIASGVQEAFGATDAERESMTSLLQELDEQLTEVQDIELDQENYSDEIELVEELNEELVRLDDLMSRFQEMDPTVLVTPFRVETKSITTQILDPTHFYVPAVIALLLQHIAITLAGLSIIKERRDGAIELFRAAPLTALETILGKFVSYLLLTAVLAIVLTLLVLYGLNVPMLGSWLNYSLVILSLLMASLAVGFLISLLAQSDSQAIQYAMIVLLASIFFSGLFLALYRLHPGVRIVSWMLPATYGTSLLQDVMLRGTVGALIPHIGLTLIGLLLLIICWLLLRRLMRFA